MIARLKAIWQEFVRNHIIVEVDPDLRIDSFR